MPRKEPIIVFSLKSVLSKSQPARSDQEKLTLKENAARMLRTSPEALQAFEQAYQKCVLEADPQTGSLFDTSAAQVKAGLSQAEFTQQSLALNERIVRELLEQASYVQYKDGQLTSGPCLSKADTPVLPSLVASADINAMPEPLRPQLTGTLMKKDIGESSYLSLLMYCSGMTDPALSSKDRKDYYCRFRQGLDILDLDPILYDILGTNKNATSHWLPAAVRAAQSTGFFKIPETRIVKIPLPMLQLSRLDYGALTPATMRVVDDFCFRAFELDENGDYFVKTGTYSSKFDFRNAHVTTPKEVHELGEYLLFIQNQAVIMAGPLATPSIFGASTTNEWVVREFIPDPENNPTIYKGLPLRTEYRAFIDLDASAFLGLSPYWRSDIMKQRFGHGPDADSPHQIHDYITYTAAEPDLNARFEQNKNKIKAEITRIIPGFQAAGLTGQWSVDVMQSGSDFWIIDMAIASTSALSDCVPKGLLRHEMEISLPDRLPNN